MSFLKFILPKLEVLLAFKKEISNKVL